MQKEKNKSAVELGKLGGAARVKDVDSFRKAQEKGRQNLAKKFKTKEALAAHYRKIGKKGKAARWGKKDVA